MKTNRFLWAIALIVAAVWASGCGHESMDPVTPGGGGGEDEIPPGFEGEPSFTFRVFRTGADSTETLRWQGTTLGPSVRSPEQTQQPIVGYGQSFRIEWLVTEDEGLRYGEWFKPMPDLEEYLPASRGAMSRLRSFRFGNRDRTAGNCDADLACIAKSYLLGSEHVFEVGAVDSAGTVSTIDGGKLRLRLGFPMVTRMEGSGQDLEYFAPDGSGPFAFADGDTLSVGSRVYVKSRVETLADRPLGSDPDSMCCNVDPSDETTAGIDVVIHVWGDPRGALPEYTLRSRSRPLHARSTFVVGSFDYEFRAVATDANGVRSESSIEVAVHGGRAPRISSISPGDGVRGILRAPFFGTTWPENEISYEVSPPLDAYWSGQGFQETEPYPGATSMVGNHYYIPVRIEGALDPKEIQSGAAAFAFEWDDGDSTTDATQESPLESDVATRPNLREAPERGVYEPTAEDRVRIFVPADIWFLPGEYDSESLNIDRRQIGEYLRRQLGDVVLRAACRSTRDMELFGTPKDPNDEGFILETLDMGPFGRVSPVASTRFSLRLGVDVGNTGSITEFFPPDGQP